MVRIIGTRDNPPRSMTPPTADYYDYAGSYGPFLERVPAGEWLVL
jgi:hypothetical protein